jgi:hypothetical protein
VGWNKRSGSTDRRHDVQHGFADPILRLSAMSDYPRVYVPGGCDFFTVVSHRRQALLADGRNIEWRNRIDYVHYNPVKHGYVARPADWRCSSFDRARRRGWYPPGRGEALPSNLNGIELE